MNMDEAKLNRSKDFTREVRRLIYQLFKNYEFFDRVCLAQYGITVCQARTIISLPDESTLNMIELSKTIGVDVSTMTRMVDQLVDKAFVNRKTDERDRRRICVGLTTQGQELRQELEQSMQNFHAELLSEIQEDEYINIIKNLELLNRIAAKAKVLLDSDTHRIAVRKKIRGRDSRI